MSVNKCVFKIFLSYFWIRIKNKKFFILMFICVLLYVLKNLCTTEFKVKNKNLLKRLEFNIESSFYNDINRVYGLSELNESCIIILQVNDLILDFDLLNRIVSKQKTQEMMNYEKEKLYFLDLNLISDFHDQFSNSSFNFSNETSFNLSQKPSCSLSLNSEEDTLSLDTNSSDKKKDELIFNQNNDKSLFCFLDLFSLNEFVNLEKLNYENEESLEVSLVHNDLALLYNRLISGLIEKNKLNYHCHFLNANRRSKCSFLRTDPAYQNCEMLNINLKFNFTEIIDGLEKPFFIRIFRIVEEIKKFNSKEVKEIDNSDKSLHLTNIINKHFLNEFTIKLITKYSPIIFSQFYSLEHKLNLILANFNEYFCDFVNYFVVYEKMNCQRKWYTFDGINLLYESSNKVEMIKFLIN